MTEGRKTRFASPTDSFKLLYIAQDLATALAETVVRDRFEGAAGRELDITDIASWGVCEVDARAPLRVLDLRRDGCFKLGVSTDIVGAKAQAEGRAFSRMRYDTADLDGILYHSRLRRRNCVAVYDRAVAPLLKPGAVVEQELASERGRPAPRAASAGRVSRGVSSTLLLAKFRFRRGGSPHSDASATRSVSTIDFPIRSSSSRTIPRIIWEHISPRSAKDSLKFTMRARPSVGSAVTAIQPLSSKSFKI